MRESENCDERALREHLARRHAGLDMAVLGELDERKREEMEFHDLERAVDDPDARRRQDELDIHANKRWYAVTRGSEAYVDAWIRREAPGRIFLDYACGNGRQAIAAAVGGARLAVGIDLSSVSVTNARRAASAADVAARCRFIQADCEATELPDACCDRILCSGMLHHLDLRVAYPELRRILRPGGRILCVEALGHNPVIQWYRNRTPHLRTRWEAEHILRLEHVEMAREWFDIGEVRFWHLLALAAVPFRRSPFFGAALSACEAIDRAVLAVPGLQRLAWQFSFELVHRGVRDSRL